MARTVGIRVAPAADYNLPIQSPLSIPAHEDVYSISIRSSPTSTSACIIHVLHKLPVNETSETTAPPLSAVKALPALPPSKKRNVDGKVKVDLSATSLLADEDSVDKERPIINFLGNVDRDQAEGPIQQPNDLRVPVILEITDNAR